jgi:hypothetical protein
VTRSPDAAPTIQAAWRLICSGGIRKGRRLTDGAGALLLGARLERFSKPECLGIGPHLTQPRPPQDTELRATPLDSAST